MSQNTDITNKENALLKFLNNEPLTSEEWSELEADADAQCYIKEALLLKATMDKAPEADPETAWQAFADRHANHHDEAWKPLSPNKSLWVALWPWMGGLSAVAMLVIAFLLFQPKQVSQDSTALSQKDVYKLWSPKESTKNVGSRMPTLAERGRMQRIIVPSGKDTHVTLPDGSEVWLNQNTVLDYPTKFSQGKREVAVMGEAYFKVKHNKAMPFVVKTGTVETKVLGTEFNVRATSTGAVHVTLLKGSVEVADNGHHKTIVPGEEARVSNGHIAVSVVDTHSVLYWREGIMYFDDVDLREVLIAMGEWYNMSVVCANKEVLQRRLHFMFDRKRPVEEAVKLLREMSQENVIVENNTIFLK